MGSKDKEPKEVPPETVDFSTISDAKDFALPKLGDLVNKEFRISSVRFGDGQFGEYAIVDVLDEGDYRTSSDVLVRQLHTIAEHTEAGKLVKVTLRKVKQYFTFE